MLLALYHDENICYNMCKNFLDTQIIKFVKPKKYRNEERWRNSSNVFLARSGD